MAAFIAHRQTEGEVHLLTANSLSNLACFRLLSPVRRQSVGKSHSMTSLSHLQKVFDPICSNLIATPFPSVGLIRLWRHFGLGRVHVRRSTLGRGGQNQVNICAKEMLLSRG